MTLVNGWNVCQENRGNTLDDLTTGWRKEFEAEVADDNFLRGGKSIMLLGEGAEAASRVMHACLIRANYKAYRITPFEIVRRMEGTYVYHDNEQTKQQFEDAECFLIDDFFFDHSDGLTASDAYRIWWFMREAVRDGVVLVIASDKEKIADIDCYPDYVWEYVEETFEVIRGSETEKQKAGGIKKRKANR